MCVLLLTHISSVGLRPAPVRCTSNQETTTDTPPAIYSSGYFTNQHTSVSVPPTFSSAASASAPATTSAPSVVSSQAVTQPNCVTDTVTLEVFRNYGSGSLSRWLDSLRIPRNNDSLQQVKELWELGSANCPPLQKCTVTMQNHRSERQGKTHHSSVNGSLCITCSGNIILMKMTYLRSTMKLDWISFTRY